MILHWDKFSLKFTKWLSSKWTSFFWYFLNNGFHFLSTFLRTSNDGASTWATKLLWNFLALKFISLLSTGILRIWLKLYHNHCHFDVKSDNTWVSGEYFLTVFFSSWQTCWGHLSHSCCVVYPWVTSRHFSICRK